MIKKPFLIPTDEPAFFLTSFSHKGLIRENNEDYLDTRSYITNERKPRSVLLAVLADGVGGHLAGEIASRLGVDTIITNFSSNENLEHPEELLEEAIIAANAAIVEDANHIIEHAGMGSTCVCALLIDQRLYIANLGDSRLYLIRDNTIQQLTFDHTWLEEIAGRGLPNAGKITRNHPLAHVLNRYLGTSEPLRVDLRIRTGSKQSNEEMRAKQGMEMKTGDCLLLMSDGICDLLSDEEILEIATTTPPAKISKRLIFDALKKGGHDNASAVTIVI